MTRLILAASLGALAAAGCASAPPTRELGQAELAVRDAENGGAPERATSDLELARAKLDRARQALERGERDTARRLAAEATVDAQVAEARADASAAETSRIEIERRLRVP